MKFSGFAEFAEDAAELAVKCQEAADEADDYFAEGLNKTSLHLKTEISRRAPRDNRTDPQAKRDGEPHLEDSVERRGRGTLKQTVVVTADHGKYVEYGTRPHTIVPKGSGPLVYYKNGRKVVRYDPVKHPGTTAQPFFRPSVEEEKQLFRGRMEKSMNDLFNDHFD